MPPAAHAFQRVVLDTSVFRRFDDAKRLLLLAPYFQLRKITSEITVEVHQELRDARKTTTLDRQRWPDVVELPRELKPEMLRRMRAARNPGDPPGKNAGEISSVLYAHHVGAALVLAEDQLAKDMCRPTDLDVPRLSTAHLVIEMVAQGHLDYDNAWPIWNAATPASISITTFHERLRENGLAHLVPAS